MTHESIKFASIGDAKLFLTEGRRDQTSSTPLISPRRLEDLLTRLSSNARPPSGPIWVWKTKSEAFLIDDEISIDHLLAAL